MNDTVVTIPSTMSSTGNIETGAAGTTLPPFLRFDKQRAIPGHIYGLVQPSLAVRVALSAQYDLVQATERLEEAFLPWVEPFPSVFPSKADISPATRFITLLDHLVAELQKEAGLPVAGRAYIRPLETQRTDVLAWFMAFPSLRPAAASHALLWISETANALVAQSESVALSEARLQSLQALLEKLGQSAPKGTNNRHFIQAAYELSIPFLSLPGGVFQYGWGRKSRLFSSSLTDATSAIGTGIARNKRQTSLILAMAGLPVPEQLEANSVEVAVEAAERIGYPVVLKPGDKDQGVGVSANLRNAADVRHAYERAQEYSAYILLERHITGRDYRINVLDGDIYSVVLRVPAGVTGDGVKSIAELITGANQDPRRSARRFSTMKPITINREAEDLLGQAGLTTASIPERGQFVQLRSAANVTSGGHSEPVHDRIHPDNIRLCREAARLLRLDIAGIDLIIPDIMRSWREIGGAICEVNAQPQIGLTFPGIFKEVFSRHVKDKGRIPVALIIGDHEAMKLVRAAAWQLSSQDLLTGFASDQDAYLGDATLGTAEHKSFNGIQALLMHPDTEAALLLRSADAISEKGLPVDYIDTLVLCEGAFQKASLRSFLNLIRPHLRGKVLLDKSSSYASDVTAVMGENRLNFAADMVEALVKSLQLNLQSKI